MRRFGCWFLEEVWAGEREGGKKKEKKEEIVGLGLLWRRKQRRMREWAELGLLEKKGNERKRRKKGRRKRRRKRRGGFEFWFDVGFELYF